MLFFFQRHPSWCLLIARERFVLCFFFLFMILFCSPLKLSSCVCVAFFYGRFSPTFFSFSGRNRNPAHLPSRYGVPQTFSARARPVFHARTRVVKLPETLGPSAFLRRSSVSGSFPSDFFFQEATYVIFVLPHGPVFLHFCLSG